MGALHNLSPQQFSAAPAASTPANTNGGQATHPATSTGSATTTVTVRGSAPSISTRST